MYQRSSSSCIREVVVHVSEEVVVVHVPDEVVVHVSEK